MKIVYKLSFIWMLLVAGIVSCNTDNPGVDYSAPNLDLVIATLETEIELTVDESTALKLSFINAEGAVKYIWTTSGNVLSQEEDYTFLSSESGSFTINVYAEDTKGKYVNTTFTIKVKDAPHVFTNEKVVVGYLPSYNNSTIKWNEITHFIYAFVYPKEDGTLDISDMSELTSYVTLAHDNNVKILVSVGGAAYPGSDVRVFTSTILDSAKRAIFVSSVNSFVREYQLDGIDIDYEELVGGGATVDDTDTKKLVPLYQELREALPSTSLITAAVSGGYGWTAYHFRNIIVEMTKELDFVTIMSYDNTGTWGGSPLGSHSSFTDAQGALNRYEEFGAAKDKLVLAVPFFGRDFLTADGGIGTPVAYDDIVTTYSPTAAEFTAGNINRDGHNIFFNSQEIIVQKTVFVKDNNYRGIGIWELGQNTTEENLSLSKDILNQF
ncbi:MAG: glycosyl hydrolase family 18 protein [Cellulophaga sp.]